MSLSLKNAVVPPSVLAAGATPSRRDGITVGREHLLRVEGARLIAEVGILLRLPQTSIGTAQILFQRFYYVASFRDHQPNDMVLGSIFLASKAEETPRKMKDIINVFFFLTEGHDKDVGAEVPSNRLYALKEAMIAAELQILVKLGFNVQVQHPHGFMINYLQSLDLSDDKDFAQLAWNYLNDSMWTEIVAIYQPHVIACGAILLASRVRKIRLPSQPPWWELFDARMEDNEQFLPALYVSSVLTEFLFRSCTFRDCLRAFNRVVPIDEYCLNVYNGKWVACTNCSDTKFLKFVLRQNLDPMSNGWIGPEPTTASADTTAGSNCLPDPLQFKHSLPDTGEQPNDREPPVARKRLHDRETSPENTTDNCSDNLRKRIKVLKDDHDTSLKREPSACACEGGIRMEPANLPSAEPLIGLVNAPTQPEGKTVALNADATIRCEAPEIQICETPFNAKAVACSMETQETALDSVQLSFCDKVLKNAKRLKDAPPFLHPVDPVLLGIPNYVDVIKCPMDLSTIQRRLSTCFYKRQTEFMNDLSLMFSNCYLFNGRDSLIGHMAQKLEHYFQNQMKGLPTRTEGYPSLSRKLSAIHATPDSKPRIRGAAIASPKKAATPKRIRKPPPVSEKAVFRFATTLLRELKTKHYSISYPFLAPVDPIRLGIPTYPLVIKNPMDFGMMLRKLDSGQYATPADFEADARLVFTNCYTFNAPESEVYNLCRRVEAIFNQKWSRRPVPTTEPKSVRTTRLKPLRPQAQPREVPMVAAASEPPPQSVATVASSPEITSESASSTDSESDDDSDSDNDIDFNEILSIMSMKRKFSRLLRQQESREKGLGRSSSGQSSHVRSKKASKSKAKSKHNIPNFLGSPTPRSKTDKKPSRRTRPSEESMVSSGAIRELTHAEKQELSKGIGELDSDKLEVVYHIIRASLPSLDVQAVGADEIEVDIDTLDRATAFRLYTFVQSVTGSQQLS